MPLILEMHSRCYLIKDAAKVDAVLKLFDGALMVDRDFSGRHYVYKHTGENPNISVTIVPQAHIIPLKAPKQIPQKASSDCNGKDFFKPEEA